MSDGQPVFVFWSYDLPPYVLGSTGTRRPDGKIYVPSYNFLFDPTPRRDSSLIAVYDDIEQARELERQLMECRAILRAQQRELVAQHMRAAYTILPELGQYRRAKGRTD